MIALKIIWLFVMLTLPLWGCLIAGIVALIKK